MFTAERDLLARLTQGSNGRIQGFKPGQYDAIHATLEGGRPILLVQRTGWGKSLVYFAATLELRRRGAGPTILISPLLSLMRDQILAARGLGLKAATLNSANEAEWDQIAAALDADDVDILLISPERLASQDFLLRHLVPLMARLALFVVDEAHCVSDWGHDFRPDYRRIRRLLAEHLPPTATVLATTATANDRVVADIEAELGTCHVIKGALARESLALQVIRLPSLAHRYAWLAEHLPRLPGSGIIYAATRGDCDRLAAWLAGSGMAVAAYHAGLDDDDGRDALEDALRTNKVKALVATTALGMGFDKPDLSFVIHLQAPLSPVHYYQQVGRAGRALDVAHGILLGGPEDDGLSRFFIDKGFPGDATMAAVLDLVEEAETGASATDLALALDLPEAEVDAVLRLLATEEEPPLVHRGGGWHPTLQPWRPDAERRQQITARRHAEWERMQAYAATRECLMTFLTHELDDDHGGDCGRCGNCRGRALVPSGTRRAAVKTAQAWLDAQGVRQRRPAPRPVPAWIAALKALLRLR